MATAYAANDDPDAALESQETGDDELDEVFERAIRRFNDAVPPQLEQRSLALIARRFATIPGAQWEGDFGDMFPDAIKVEVNLVRDGLEKIYRDYNENRIIPDFRPAGGKGDEDSADTLDGLHRADSYRFKAQQGRDNAFMEGTAGGFGAYRLTNEWADPYDKDSDTQRINPGLVIVDADQRVFFDPNAKLYDKCDARYAFVITAKFRDAFEEEYPDATSDWAVPIMNPVYDWFSDNAVKVAEYYECEDRQERLFILSHKLSGAEERYWESELAPDELAELKQLGWKVKTRNLKRERIHKYILSGEEVLADKGIIAGDCIPIVPYYGKRSYVDGVERFSGYVQERMDRQRLYNAAVSKIAETSAQSPREIPIFAQQQMPPNLADQWANQVVDRHAFALVEPLVDPATGAIISAGPIGKVEAPQVDPSTAAILQIARNDLVEGQQDGSEEAKANTSADALEIAATRVDAKSGIFLDNFRQSVQREGEVYLGMAADIYYEPGREVETMSEDGNDGVATLVQPYTDPKGVAGHKNDFSRGNYKVIADVTEATATRRDKTVKSCLNTAAVAAQLGDTELAQAALITAIANQDGEGMSDLQKFARQKAIMAGIIEPNDDEKAQMEQAQEQAAQAPPDPNQQLAEAKAADLEASAKQRGADTVLKIAQATAVGGPDAAPAPPDGLEAVHKAAQVAKTAAETDKIRTDTAHLPQKLAIEQTNAASNQMKARHSAFAGLAKLLGRKSSDGG